MNESPPGAARAADPRRNRLRRTVAVLALGLSVFGTISTASAQRAYVTNINSNSISKVDFSTGTEISNFSIGGVSTFHVAVTPNGRFAYVTNIFEGTVTVLETASDTVVATIPTGAFAEWVAVSPDGARVYVTNRNDDSVSVINVDTNTVIDTIPVGDSPSSIAISPDGSRAYVTSGSSNTVSVINTNYNFVFSTVTVGDNPSDVAFSPDSQRAYVTNLFGDSVSVIDVTTDSVIGLGTIPVGSGPISVAVNEEGTRAWVLNNFAPSLTEIDLVTLTPIGGLPVSDANPASIEIRGDCLYRTQQFGGVNPGAIDVLSIGPDCSSIGMGVGSYPGTIAFIDAPANDECENAQDVTDGLYVVTAGTGQIGDGVSFAIGENGEWFQFGSDYFQSGGYGFTVGGKIHAPFADPDLWFRAAGTAWMPGPLEDYAEFAVGGDCYGTFCSGPLGYEGAVDGTDNWMKVVRDGDGAVSWAQFEFDFSAPSTYPPVDSPILVSIPLYVTRTDGADFTLAEAQIALTGAIPGDLSAATNDGTATCGDSSTSPDAWYRYVAPSDGVLSVSTCGTHDANGVDSGMDTVLSLHDGCGGAEIACNDDTIICAGLDSGSLRDSAVSIPLVSGEEVFVRVASFGGTPGGPFRLNVDFVASPPANDDCGNATPVTEGMYFGSTAIATNDGSASCGDSDSNADVWYAYTAFADGTLRVNTCGTHDGPGTDLGIDTVLAAFAGCGGAELDCNDDWPFGSDSTGCDGADLGVTRDSAFALPVLAGDVVVIRVSTYGGSPPGDFQLNVDFDLPVCTSCVGIRGDVNGDMGIDIGDPIAVLAFLFSSGAAPAGCSEAGDANADGGVNIGDAIYLLNFLFANGSPPAAPGYPSAECLDLP